MIPGPTLSGIAEALGSLLSWASIVQHVVPSILRVFAALSVSAAIGIPLGALAAQRRLGGGLVSLAISAIRYLPPTAFIGLLVLSLGIGSQTAVALIVLGIAPYIAIMSADAFSGVPRDYVHVATVFGATRSEVVTRVALPYVTPRLIEAVRVNVGAAWTFLIVAEIIAGNSGIGFLIARAQRFLQVQDLYALLLICGVCGIIMDRALALVVRWTGRWSNHAFG